MSFSDRFLKGGNWVNVFVLLALIPVASAQDVGMGERRAKGERLENPYSLAIETPHVKWAKPLAGGPIRILAVPSVQEGRTLVEIAQRLELELTTVTIDPDWEINKWTMAFGEDYGARAAVGDLSLIYSYLEEELISDRVFDVILLPLHHGWSALSETSRNAIEDRVRKGCGLVLIRPTEHALSPLVPISPVGAAKDTFTPLRSPSEGYRQIEPDFEQSRWRKVSEEFVVRAIPIESFPFEYLENYRYKLAPGARALVVSETGNPIIAARTFGKGQVLGFGFRNIGLSWRMSNDALGRKIDLYWEYFYSMMVRALIYAAGRQPEDEVDWEPSRWVLKSENGETVRRGTAENPGTAGLKPGRYFLEQFGAYDWKIAAVEKEQKDSISSLEIGPRVLDEGDLVRVQYLSTGPSFISLIDGYDRVIAESGELPSGEADVTLKVEKPLTHSGFAVVQTGTAERKVAVRFVSPDREWKDYEVILPWFGPRSYQPWTPTLDQQFRKIGITTLGSPERNFKIIASVHEPAFGIYHYDREEYEKRKAEYLRTGDKNLIRRDVSLHNPSLFEDMKKRFEDRVGDIVPLKPFAYYLADESSLTCYSDAFDVDFSPEALAEFRTWLEKEYGDLSSLNRAWGTRFDQWAAVIPYTTEEAQKEGNFVSWSDHRVFMEGVFIRTIRQAGKIAREFDPEARVSFSGTQIPAPQNGANWYEIDQIVDYLQPYSGGNQDAMHYLFNPNLRLTGFTGYGLVGTDVQHEVWRRLFYGHSGASIFWHYTLLNPDLTLSAQGEALVETFGKVQSGIGRVFMNSKVIEDGVAIHFSMASIRGAWMTDGKIVESVVSARKTSEAFAELMNRRDRWVQELEKRGIQFRFLATPQIEKDELSNYKILILPYSIALSDREIARIEEFAARGGRVYIDEQTGRMDEKLRWRKEQVWRAGKTNFLSVGPEGFDLERSIRVKGSYLTTIRSYGESRLYGLLPETASRIELPPTDGYRYDLMTGGEAEPVLQTSPGRPALILERTSQVSSIKISKDLTIHLADSRGNPVDRSVVTVDVFDPDEKFIHYYSKNVDIHSGTGQIQIPFALNAPTGRWKIRARDVVSGLTDELVIVR